MTSLLLAVALLLQAQVSNGVITGRLLLGDGKPAAAMRVTAKPVAEPGAPTVENVLLGITQTDSEGRFRLENLSPGRYYVTAGLVGSPTYLPGTTNLTNATEVAVTRGAVSDVAPFALAPISIATTPSPILVNNDTRVAILPKLTQIVSLDVLQDPQQAFESIGSATGIHVLFDRRFVNGAPAAFKVQASTALVAFEALASQSGMSWLPISRDTIAVVPASVGTRNLDLKLTAADLRKGAVYAGFHPANDGPFALDVSGQARSVLETIARKSGLTVAFDRDYRVSVNLQLKLENADIYSALDIASAMNRTLWVPISGNTIFVGEDNITKRRSFESQVVKVYYPTNFKTPQDFTNAFNMLVRSLSIPVAVNAQGAIVLKGSPQKIASADQLLAELDKATAVRASAIETDFVGNVFAIEKDGIRNLSPIREALQPLRKDPITMDITELPSKIYEQLAELAGIQVVFDPNLRFTPGQLRMNIDHLDIFAALDVLSAQTATFWTPLNRRTIFVAGNNSTSRRDFDPTIVKVFYLPSGVQTQDTNRIMNIVRQSLNTTVTTVDPSSNAIIVRDEPRKMLQAEWLMAELAGMLTGNVQAGTRPTIQSSAAIQGDTVVGLPVRDSFSIRDASPMRAAFDPPNKGPISVEINGDTKAIFDAVGTAIGIGVKFDSSLVTGPNFSFRVENESASDVINILSIQTRTNVYALDERTILVAPALSGVRNAPQFLREKDIELKHARTTDELTSVVNTVRMMTNNMKVIPLPESNSIRIQETAAGIRTAEELIQALDTPPR